MKTKQVIMKNRRENILKTVRFETPEFIPMNFYINAACWNHYDQNQLQDLMEAHPFLFPGFVRKEKVVPVYLLTQRKDFPYRDPWNCVWETAEDGITGSVHQHPLADWSALDGYSAPDPDKTNGTHPMNWPEFRERSEKARAAGDIVIGSLPHGHTFLRLQDIRGYENLIFDMMDDDPRLIRLIGMVEEFNYSYVQRWMEIGPDMMSYPEDLGMQVGPMISPDLFRKYIKPVYRRIMQPARDRGCIVHMHSDGDIRLLIEDLIDGGVDVVNLQDLVNGIDWIRDNFAGRTCIDLDIDRQRITARGSPEEVDALIREEVEKLGSRRGGLWMKYDLYPGVPIENVKALMDSMERYAGYYS
jgi:hypothetical protein